jgi:short-subunit dehydrogenase
LITFPPATNPGLSGYITSKFALTRFIACIAAENPSVFAAALNPGMVYTALTNKLGADLDTLPLDDGEKP